MGTSITSSATGRSVEGGVIRPMASYNSSLSSPWPWLSSGPVERYSASLQPGPWRRSSAHVAAMSGAVALFAAWRQPVAMPTPAIVDIMKSQKGNAKNKGHTRTET